MNFSLANFSAPETNPIIFAKLFSDGDEIPLGEKSRSFFGERLLLIASPKRNDLYEMMASTLFLDLNQRIELKFATRDW
ncbi:MAG: hypothetical protein PHV02_03140 [Rhodocyclaceae bacterium]|nr:hypothetical protein [Rhodocyclaceae bacterium]